MVRLCTRIRTFGFIVSLLAVLAMGISVEPRQALARPVSTGGPDGTPYGTGDPTGDDIPSPTPKPTSLQTAQTVRAPGTATVRGISTSVRWNLYLSILVRLGLR
jgi:hypothetical protein